jgi:hypothetical protein
VGEAAGEERQRRIAGNRNAAFYEGQIQTARYFIASLLPVTLGKMAAVRAADSAVVDIPEASFGG